MRGVLVLAACGVMLHGAAALALEGDWRVARLEETPLAAEGAPVIAFRADGRVSGSGGCNRFAGTYAQTGESLRFAALATTRMACPPERMDLESRFLALVGTVTRVAFDEDGRLRLLAGDRQVLLLEPAP